MIYNNRSYPHPVLGINDDFIDSEINVNLKVSSTGQFIELVPAFVVTNKEIMAIIQSGHATYISHVYCRGTLYREVFKNQKNLTAPIRISANQLNGEVEVDFFICAATEFNSYSNKLFNSDYGGTKFKLDKGDIIAYGGKGKFYANKSPEELKAISSLMNIDCTGESKKPMYLDYDGQRITIMLCVEDYNNYRFIKHNEQSFGILLSSLVLPSLLEALYFLNDPASADYQDYAWYKALKKIKDDSKEYSDALRIAQSILENPITKCFDFLVNPESND